MTTVPIGCRETRRSEPVSPALLQRSPEVLADADLLSLAADGCREGFAVLYERHSPMLLAMALKMLRNRPDAEEVVQEVFIYAWRRAADYDRNRAAVSSWLVLIVRSRCLDRLRSFQRMDAMLAVVGREAPDAEGPKSYSKVLERQRAARLHDALRRLPEAQREVLEHSFFGGLTQREVAELTGIPLGTVKTRTLLAMQKLRRELGPESFHLR